MRCLIYIYIAMLSLPVCFGGEKISMDNNEVIINDFIVNGNVTKGFQDALDYAYKNQIYLLKIKSGNYVINKQLLIKSSIKIQGDGGATIRCSDAVNNNLFYNLDGRCENIELANLEIVSLANKLKNILTFDGRNRELKISFVNCIFKIDKPIVIKRSSSLTVLDCEFLSNNPINQSMILVHFSNNISIENNRFNNVGGVQFINQCENIHITNNTFNSSGAYPIHFDKQRSPYLNHSNAIIENNSLSGNGLSATHGGTFDQISCFNVNNLIISGNKIVNGGDMGITIRGCSNVLIKDNICQNNSTSGITVGDIENVVIQNNYLIGNGVRTGKGININARAGIYIYGNDKTNLKKLYINNNIISLANNKDDKQYFISASLSKLTEISIVKEMEKYIAPNINISTNTIESSLIEVSAHKLESSVKTSIKNLYK